MTKTITYYFWSDTEMIIQTVTMDNYTDLDSAYNYCAELMKAHPKYNGKSQVFVKEVK